MLGTDMLFTNPFRLVAPTGSLSAVGGTAPFFCLCGKSIGTPARIGIAECLRPQPVVAASSRFQRGRLFPGPGNTPGARWRKRCPNGVVGAWPDHGRDLTPAGAWLPRLYERRMSGAPPHSAPPPDRAAPPWLRSAADERSCLIDQRSPRPGLVAPVGGLANEHRRAQTAWPWRGLTVRIGVFVWFRWSGSRSCTDPNAFCPKSPDMEGFAPGPRRVEPPWPRIALPAEPWQGKGRTASAARRL